MFRRSGTTKLVVVEVKLAGSYNYKGDVRKLRRMINPEGSYRYAVGVHLALNVPKQCVTRAHV